MGRLADKNILITGGNSGIGLAAAQEFDREGARVATGMIAGVESPLKKRTWTREAGRGCSSGSNTLGEAQSGRNGLVLRLLDPMRASVRGTRFYSNRLIYARPV